MKLTRKSGLLLLGIWLILTGLLPLLAVKVRVSELVMHILALIAGILIVLDR